VIEDLWYKNTVIYSLDLDSFMDASGDGRGDFEGLIRRLDYLQSLGVGAVWLAPFHPSPLRDNGYDVSDYYGVHRRYGSSGDFVEFMHQAHKRGIRVVMDLVINHTSRDHPWFQSARSDPDSPYRDWYVWSKKRPKNWNRGMVFPGVQDRTWTYDEEAKAYYYHRFYEHQPDLNMDNPAVRTELRRVIGYWLQQGIAGFRIDALPFVIESTVPGKEMGDQHFEYLAEFRRFAQWRVGDAILLGEANVLPKETRAYFANGHGDGIHMMFNFWVNQYLFHALATEEVKSLADALRATKRIPSTAQWAHFLRNHDELDLGRLSEEERAAVFSRFAPDEGMQLYGRGIRRRLAPMLGDPRLEMLAYSVMFSLPGTPVIRYGDELGMGDDLDLPEREAVRTPMQWADEPHAGFTTSDSPTHPVIEEGIWGYRRVNVEAQRRNPDSLLNWTARMIRLRKECPEIGWGEWTILRTGSPNVLALRYDWRGNSLVTVHNFASHPKQVRVAPGVERGERMANLIAEEESVAEEGQFHLLTLEPYGFKWFRVGGLNYAVWREKE
jgi:maltose alpha-D-glucosyltransferase / alpha-amylase